MATSEPNKLSSILIPLVSKIREVLEETGCSNSVDLALPRIVVVGSQSAGKSSVLENIIGHSILPRGTGIVTRVPLVLTLHCPSEEEQNIALKSSNSSQNEWGEFLHLPNEKVFCFDKIRSIITERTIELAGNDRGVIDAPIYLKICSPKLLDLTLVDLPGITRVPVGDQPSDIENQIRQLCLKYIDRESSIILAVTAANTDITNSDALQLAKQVDPKGERTIGVLTKIDLMDRGTNCLKVLMNQVHPLVLGYIAVVNRGQLDIDQSVGIETALSREKSFFESHDVYGTQYRSGSLSGSFGTDALVLRLVTQLHGCIVKALPRLRQRVKNLKLDCENELLSLGKPILEVDMKRHCLDQIAKFSRRLCESLDGIGDTLDASHDELSAVAELTQVFDLFYSSLAKIDALEGLDDQHILKTIKNSDTLPPSILLPEKAYQCLVREQIARLEQPGTQCVDLVHERLLAVAKREQRHCSDGGNRFPQLMKRIDEIVANFIAPLIVKSKERIEEVIDGELAYIHTTDPKFLESQQKMLPLISEVLGVPQKVIEDQPPQQETNHSKVKKNEEEVYHKLEVSENKRLSSESDSSNNSDDKNNNQGPFWKGWLSGFQDDSEVDQTDVNMSRPRRGGRRSSFGISQSDIDAFRSELIQSKVTTSPMRMKTNHADVFSPPELPNKEVASLNLVKEMIKSYFSVVSQSFSDRVPKTIMAVIVNNLKKNLQTELITALYEDTSMVELMSEPVNISNRRIELQKLQKVFIKADNLLSDTPSLALPMNFQSKVPTPGIRGILSPKKANNTTIGGGIKKNAGEVQFNLNKENQISSLSGKGSVF